MVLDKKQITLIGGAGFIGHNLALKLKELNADVSIIDSLQVNNLVAFHSSDLDFNNRNLYQNILNRRLHLLKQSNIPLYTVDARDYHLLCRILNELKPQVIIHLAAVAHADRSNKTPYSTFDHSFRTLENALDNSKNSSVEHFIYFSSSMVYGDFNVRYVTEQAPCMPMGIYGALKLGGEMLVIAYHQVFNLPYTIVRPSQLYGRRCVSRRVIQIFIENAIQKKDIIIHGEGFDRLDFTYIDDLVNGIVNVLENPKSINQTFNITYGESRPIIDVAKIIEKYYPSINVKFVPKDKLTPNRGTLCIDKAKEMIGYEPKYSIEKGIEKYVEWYGEVLT